MTTSLLREDVHAPTAPRQRWARLPLRALTAVAGGLVLWLAFPPVGAWPCAVLGVALIALAVEGASVRRGALLGLLAGLAELVPLLSWTSAVAGPAAWLALAVVESLFFLALGAALAAISRLPGWPLWAAGLWVGQEALRSRLPFGGFTWGRLAFSQPDGPLAALAALGGAPLVSFAVALGGGLLALGLRVLLPGRVGEPALAAQPLDQAEGRALAAHPQRQPARTRYPARVRAGQAAALVAGAALLLAALLMPTPTGGPTTRVALVQGNVPRLGLSAFAQRSAVLRNHVEATHTLAADVRAGRVAPPDLVVWPENASDLDPFTDPAAYQLIDDAVRDVGVPVLVGAVLQGPGDKISNAGIVWDPRTGPGARYVKQHPVPFGEYMPLRAELRVFSDKVDLVPRDFAFGDHTGLLQVGPATVGDVICFEIGYDGLVRDAVRAGGRMLVVQTNNATFGRSAESAQQLQMSRLRAVEHGRAVLVAATSGISAVISPDGTVSQRSQVFTQQVLTADVPQRDALTPATRLGAWPELGLALLGAGALVGTAVGRRRR